MARPTARFHHRHRMTLGIAVIFAAVLSLGFVWHSMYLKEQHEALLARTEALAHQTVEHTREAFAQVPLLRAGEASALNTSRNNQHVAKGQALGIKGLPTRDATAALGENRAMAELVSNRFYRVEKMDYSVPYVTQSTANMLKLMGIRFHEALREEGLPPYRYVITSATRTREDQRRLRRINGNAATRSAHEFGTTVDIHYRLFDYVAAPVDLPDSLQVDEEILHDRLHGFFEELALTRQQKLKAILGRVILEMQNEGYLLVRYERRQPVYHVTLARDLEEPEDPVIEELVARNRRLGSQARARAQRTSMTLSAPLTAFTLPTFNDCEH